MTWTLLAGLVFATWVWVIVNGILARRAMRPLSDIPLPEGAPARVSVIVPARNEERALGACLESLLAQRGVDIEIIVVDDRSTDATGVIADAVAARSDGRLRVVHVADLPAGWLGKCHALHVGAREATSERLLFTDGDVIFAPDSVARAVTHMERTGADHVVVFPEPITETLGEEIAMVFWGVFFAEVLCPALVVNPASRSYIGVGAFNLVRRSAYEAVGGHERLRLHVADDVALGQMMKWSGHRIEILMGMGLVRVRWQDGVRGFVTGLEKNGFAAAGFSIVTILAGVTAIAFVHGWPWVGLFVGRWPARALCAAVALGLQPLVHVSAARQMRKPPVAGLLAPIGAAFLIASMVRSTVLTLWRGGIRWRDTFHPLGELRAFQREFQREMAARWRASRRRLRSTRSDRG